MTQLHIERVRELPQLPIYKATYRGYNFIYKDRRGPPCTLPEPPQASQTWWLDATGQTSHSDPGRSGPCQPGGVFQSPGATVPATPEK